MARQLTRRGALGLIGVGGLAALTGVGLAATRQGGGTAGGSGKAKALCGQMLLPGDEGFDQETQSWITIVEHRPKVVFVPECPADVQYAMRYAAKENLPVAVQATGHGVSVPADGAVFINTRKMTGVKVNPNTGTVTVEPGVKAAPVIQQAAQHGLAPLVGSTSDVGVVGFLTGGGLPVLGRRYGYACDMVTAFDIVTADGELLRATPTSNKDLFYAARGGKHNFGVITSIETRLTRQARLYGGSLAFPGQRAADVLRAYLRWARRQPKEMSSSIVLAHGLPGPDGKPVDLAVKIRIAFTGSAAEGKRLVRPLRGLNPVQDTVQEMPYTQIDTIHKDPTKPTPAYYRSALLKPVDDAIVDRLMAVIGTGAGLPPGTAEFRHMGGALARDGAVPSPIGFRNSAYQFFTLHPAPPDKADGVKKVNQDLIDAVGPWRNGGIVPNFLGYNETSPRGVRSAYESRDYDRLRAVKRTRDPKNRLRINFNIPPA